MPIARKQVPQDFLDQMKSNLKKEESVQVEEPFSDPSEPVETVPEKKIERAVETEKPAAKVEVPADSEKKADKYADVMNVRLSKGLRNEIKTFCSGCGISVTQYIETSFKYLSDEVAAGRIEISKGGITKVEN